MDGWVGGWVDGWVYGWMDGHTNLYIFDIHDCRCILPPLRKCPVAFSSLILRPRIPLHVIPMVKLCPSKGTAENG